MVSQVIPSHHRSLHNQHLYLRIVRVGTLFIAAIEYVIELHILILSFHLLEHLQQLQSLCLTEIDIIVQLSFALSDCMPEPIVRHLEFELTINARDYHCMCQP